MSQSDPEPRRRWWREPLVHFVVLGGLAFLVHRVLFGAPQSDYIDPADAPVEQLRQDWLAATGSLPDQEKEAALIGEWVDDEILYRRAIELGLDQNDTIVRRRLVQRMRFFIQDTYPIEPPTDTQLRAWIEQHPEEFAMPQRVSFRHLFFSRGERGSELSAAAVAALETLQNDPTAVVEADPFFRGNDFQNLAPAETERTFGREFEQSIRDLPLGEWAGPLRSSYGLHLVVVESRTSPEAPTLEALREEVEQDWLASERARHNEEALAKLRARYAPGVTP